MAEADLLYSSVIATAIVLFVWMAALATATYIFFDSSPHPLRSSRRKKN
ncbi:MAG TPA: hypothetical protein VMI10_20505 [Terriglobales bacterium]|nr:hypothetical protein [Terriglobales bacterium]